MKDQKDTANPEAAPQQAVGVDALVRTFDCDGCGHTYTTRTTRQEKERGFAEDYGESLSDCTDALVSLCDYCHAEVMRQKDGES